MKLKLLAYGILCGVILYWIAGGLDARMLGLPALIPYLFVLGCVSVISGRSQHMSLGQCFLSLLGGVFLAVVSRILWDLLVTDPGSHNLFPLELLFIAGASAPVILLGCLLGRQF